MQFDEQHPYDWRGSTANIGTGLARAHSTVDHLDAALDGGDDVSARLVARSALEAVRGVADAVQTLSAERPPDARLSDADALGSTLAICGSEVATVALDVMVNAMMALAATDDEVEADFLIGACLDAATAYETAAAVVDSAPQRHGRGILDLKRTFEREGAALLGDRITNTRPRVLDIRTRLGDNIGA